MPRVPDLEGAHLAALRRLDDFRDKRILEFGCGDGGGRFGALDPRLHAWERDIRLGSVWRCPALSTIPSRRCLNTTRGRVAHNRADELSGPMSLRDATAHSVNTTFATS